MEEKGINNADQNGYIVKVYKQNDILTIFLPKKYKETNTVRKKGNKSTHEIIHYLYTQKNIQ